ncbi:WAP four-disulfide core domain protein 5 isoform X1 [Xenopus tropicalis]|uniref:WAP four-disulfide core domain protein 5 isoform X1 n=1 Tax=Xenopus tropicalis TaxID=8364 RepID=A0A8J1JLC5_XENTR|nr:WAP four-disulfide core domain protein 5 isoform X1 [Xenopus tropicalis]
MLGTGSALLLGITLCCLGTWAKETIKVHNVCPVLDPDSCKPANPGTPGCKSDRDCSKHQKCCCVKCGWKCVTTVQVKQGRCPPKMANCTTPASHPDTPTCKSDFECPGHQKCCDQCGNICRDPMEEKWGICPTTDNKQLECPNVRCRANADCPPNQKCCQFGGKQDCMNIH